MGEYERVMNPKNDNPNRLRERMTKMAELMGIADDPAKMKILFNALKTQHKTTQKNFIRYLKNNYPEQIKVSSYRELRTISVTEYVKLDAELDKYVRHQEKNQKAYVRHPITVGLDQIHALVGKEKRANVGGIEVNIKSPRFKMFKRGCDCVKCGIKGSFYAVERTRKNKDGNFDWHLNCYGIKEIDGRQYEVLMTQDHIIPKSKGGRNDESNLQTMCEFCNKSKDSKNDEVFKNGHHKVSFKTVNAVAKKYGIEIQKHKDEQYFFWSGASIDPNMNISRIERTIIEIPSIECLTWGQWMDELTKVADKLRLLENEN